MKQTFDAAPTQDTDPIGMDLPEERLVWRKTSNRCAKKWPSNCHHPPGIWGVRFTTEAECSLFWYLSADELIEPKQTDIKESLVSAKANKYVGVLILTYADGAWKVLAEYRV